MFVQPAREVQSFNNSFILSLYSMPVTCDRSVITCVSDLLVILCVSYL